MANTTVVRPIWLLIGLYVLLSVASVCALGVLALVLPDQTSTDAWGHAVIVLVFAFVLPMRWRGARQGSQGALRAVGLISAILLIVNAVEGQLGNDFPLWMRIEMFAVAALMLAVIALVIRAALDKTGTEPTATVRS